MPEITAGQKKSLYLNLCGHGPSDSLQGINLPFSGGRYETPDWP
jgi:hypothetical protein